MTQWPRRSFLSVSLEIPVRANESASSLSKRLSGVISDSRESCRAWASSSRCFTGIGRGLGLAETDGGCAVGGSGVASATAAKKSSFSEFTIPRALRDSAVHRVRPCIRCQHWSPPGDRHDPAHRRRQTHLKYWLQWHCLPARCAF